MRVIEGDVNVFFLMLAVVGFAFVSSTTALPWLFVGNFRTSYFEWCTLICFILLVCKQWK